MVIFTKEVPGEFIEIAMDVWTKPFWEAAKEEHLVLPRCGSCGHYRLPPSCFCPECTSQKVDWVAHSGKGILYSYTVIERTPFPGEVPNFLYAPVVVEFPDAGNVRLIGTLIGVAAKDIRVDMAVKTAWSTVRDGWKVPVFVPDSKATSK
jgi:uncharacterized OB-fold protein